MKNFFKYALIAFSFVSLMGLYTSCSKDDDKEPEERSITLNVDVSEVHIKVGEEFVVKAEVTPEGTALLWTSADRSIATVDNGKITGVGEGNTIVLVRAGEAVEKTISVFVSKEDKGDEGEKEESFEEMPYLKSWPDKDDQYEEHVAAYEAHTGRELVEGQDLSNMGAKEPCPAYINKEGKVIVTAFYGMILRQHLIVGVGIKDHDGFIALIEKNGFTRSGDVYRNEAGIEVVKFDILPNYMNNLGCEECFLFVGPYIAKPAADLDVPNTEMPIFTTNGVDMNGKIRNFVKDHEVKIGRKYIQEVVVNAVVTAPGFYSKDMKIFNLSIYGVAFLGTPMVMMGSSSTYEKVNEYISKQCGFGEGKQNQFSDGVPYMMFTYKEWDVVVYGEPVASPEYGCNISITATPSRVEVPAVKRAERMRAQARILASSFR